MASRRALPPGRVERRGRRGARRLPLRRLFDEVEAQVNLAPPQLGITLSEVAYGA